MSGTSLKIFVHGSCVYIIGNAVTGILNYLIRRTMSVNLTVAEYGSFYSSFAVISLIMAFTDLGLVQAGTVLVSENAHLPDRKKLSQCFSAVFLLKLVFAVSAFAAVFLCHGWIVRNYLGNVGGAAFFCLSFLLLFQVCETAFTSLWNGLKRFTVTNAVASSRAMFLFLCVLFLTKRFALAGAALAYVVTAAVFLTVSFLLYGGWQKLRIVFHIPGETWKRLCHLTGFIAFSTLLLNIIFHMDTIMLTSLKGVESSAVYNIALPVAQLVFSPLVFATVFLPIAVSMVKEQKYSALRKAAFVSILITLLVLPLVVFGMYLLAPFLIRILFNEKFIASAAPVLPVLSGGFILYALGNMIAQILIAFNSIRLLLTATTVAFFCNLLLNFLFIRFWDVEGAAWATCLSYFIFSVLMTVFFFRELKQRLDEDSCHAV